MATDPKVTTHAGVAIYVGADGDFYGVVDSHKREARTLVALKREIDNSRRLSSRAAAADLEAVVLVRDGYGHTHRETWYEGTFAGLNAHTGDVSLKLATGKLLSLTHHRLRFFKAGDPAIARIKELLDANRVAQKAAEVADNALDDALKASSFEIDMGYARRTTEGAAKAEEALLKALA